MDDLKDKIEELKKRLKEDTPIYGLGIGNLLIAYGEFLPPLVRKEFMFSDTVKTYNDLRIAYFNKIADKSEKAFNDRLNKFTEDHRVNNIKTSTHKTEDN